MLELFSSPVRQMSTGECAALEGLLSQLRPSLAIEIGTAEGGTLERIATWSEEVHSFDLVAPSLPVPPNAVLHTGDAHRLLPEFLSQLAESGGWVDFVLVDGDHTASGVRRDLQGLLDSGAVERTVIVIHDTANEEVRRGVDAMAFAEWPKVHYVEPDWIPGQLLCEPGAENELWGGLGLLLVDTARGPADGASPYQARYHPHGPLLAEAREIVLTREKTGLTTDESKDHRLLERELARARKDLADTRLRLEGLATSRSWRMTAPMRAALGRLRNTHAADGGAETSK